MLEYAEGLLAMVSGELEPAAFSARFGEGGSSSDAIAFYREMVRRQRRLIVDTFYAAARRLCPKVSERRWDDVAERFIRERPPRHPYPPIWALTFDAFLRDTGELHEPILRELVDFARVRFQAMHVAHEARIRLDHDVLLRLYEYDVDAITRAVDSETDLDAVPRVAPTKQPLVIARARTTGRLIVRAATLPTLVVLDRAAGSLVAPPADLSPELLAEEEERLVRAGILPTP